MFKDFISHIRLHSYKIIFYRTKKQLKFFRKRLKMKNFSTGDSINKYDVENYLLD